MLSICIRENDLQAVELSHIIYKVKQNCSITCSASEGETDDARKILFLGPEDSPLIPWLQEQSEEVIQTSDRLSAREVSKQGYSFLVSYGYRHILRKDILDIFPGRAINLHISLLPWNRGADPNFWSFVEDTPKGVTIHYLDEGVDTGDIIAQQETDVESNYKRASLKLQEAEGCVQYGEHLPEYKKHMQETATEVIDSLVRDEGLEPELRDLAMRISMKWGEARQNDRPGDRMMWDDWQRKYRCGDGVCRKKQSGRCF